MYRVVIAAATTVKTKFDKFNNNVLKDNCKRYSTFLKIVIITSYNAI